MKTINKTLALSTILAMTLGFASFSSYADVEPQQHTYQFEGPTNPNARGDFQLQSKQQIQNRVNEQQAMQIRNQYQSMQTAKNMQQIRVSQNTQLRQSQQQMVQNKFRSAR